MTAKTMTITRALVELKRLDARISSAVTSGMFSGVQVGVGQKARTSIGKSVNEVKDSINASFQSVEDLIAQRMKLKAAVVASNAKVEVVLSDKRMTVAGAIDLKATLPARKAYLSAVKSQFSKAKIQVETNNTKLEADLQSQLNTLLGANAATSQETIEILTKNARDDRQASLIQQDLIERKLNALEEEILAIETELDFVLSESNALTTITV